MTPAYRPGRRSHPLRLGPSAPEARGANPPQPSSPIPCVFHAEGQCGDRARATLGPHLLPLCRLGVSSGDAEWQGARGDCGTYRAGSLLVLCSTHGACPERAQERAPGVRPEAPACSARCLPRPRTCAGSFSKPAGPRWASRGGSGVAGSSPCWGKVGKDTGHPPWSQARRQRAKGTPGRRHGGDSEVPGRFAIGGGQQGSALEVSTA